jgi:hypothetical protein
MRLFSVTLAGFMALAAIATMASCTQPASAPPPNALTQGCPAGVPFVQGAYDNGKGGPCPLPGLRSQIKERYAATLWAGSAMA